MYVHLYMYHKHGISQNKSIVNLNCINNTRIKCTKKVNKMYKVTTKTYNFLFLCPAICVVVSINHWS